MDKKYFEQFPNTVQKQLRDETNQLLVDIYVDLFLNTIHRDQTRERIVGLIDEALDLHDGEAFERYTKMLKQFDEEQ